MYNEWFDFLRTLQEGEEPLQLMNFSFVAGRSARYGSWGILETMDQDTTTIPAPKYAAILEAIEACDLNVSTAESINSLERYRLFPNPATNFLTITGDLRKCNITVVNSIGAIVLNQEMDANSAVLNVGALGSGNYTLKIDNGASQRVEQFIVLE
jgi:hypothetical protein